ncbi:MAG TPA: 1-(5-phosphoribosyl)-5-[(5-phosphoribosylamino)methylideneamino]imidazole-4-carboxamide isomerase [Solirubrobacteraceae bacterium]|nr:1-(5-phosphoribosyl)-5-[(5-phosphoribosylamino)methylideneamino]imidazole-4-carboxamide isomerase [Solirubrobacteraceae bacterium]
MNLYPAIDILGGNAVRLSKGDFDAKKVYDQDPLSAARAFAEEGARYLHVVDLDGAKRGEPVNLEHVRRIASALDVPVQLGGGLRSDVAIQRAFQAGVSRVILGTAIFSDPEMPYRAMTEHGAERVLIGIDARDGYVATHGWLEKTKLPACETIERWDEGAGGVKRFVYTNIDHDGMLDGPDLDDATAIARAVGDGELILSGGIGELEHLRALVRLRSEQGLDGLDGVIVGKALYEHRFTVAEAQRALRDALAG